MEEVKFVIVEKVFQYYESCMSCLHEKFEIVLLKTKMCYWTKDQNFFLNAVILISIYYLIIMLMIDILFKNFQ